MATTPRTRKPRTADVVLDLDELELEGDVPPFIVRIGGQPVTFIDILDLDWQVAASLSPERPFQFFDEVVPEDQKDHFLAQKFPMRKMQHLAEAYRQHYGIGDEAQGNSAG